MAGGKLETAGFKTLLDKLILETAGAFVDARGGTIFIRVANSGHVVALLVNLDFLVKVA